MFVLRNAAVCLAFIVALANIAAANEKPPQPNIVFLIADDLGSHDVGWRGSEIKTPNLDRLAASGAKLDQFYVQPVCTPTRASLMTGRYPFRYGLQSGVVKPWAQYGLPLEKRLLPQALKEAGYQTAIVGKWHLGHFQPDYLPTRRGFDHQYGHYNGALDYFAHIRDGGFDWHRDDKVNHDEGYSTELIGREASRLIKERIADKPLFLYVPFNGVHAPLQVPERYSDAYPQFSGKRKTYAGMVTAMDEAIGKIVTTLEEAKLLDNTLIVFSSDNGGPAPGVITSNGKLRAGKGTLYEGGVRVCAFATWAGHIKPSVVETPMHMTDWYPTLLQLAGAKLEQPLATDGRDIWPALTGGTSSRDTFVLNLTPNNGAIRVGNWKLVTNGSSEAEDEATEDTPTAAQKKRQGKKQRATANIELFNLAEDPSEKHNLATDNPEKVKDLQGRLAAFAKEAVPPKVAPKAASFVTPKIWGEVN
ncbi:MAG: arylsulfatase [Planctomycetota bacterium]